MRLFTLFAFLAVLATVVLAWEKEDHEIFDLVSDVERSEGKGTTFYSWLDVPPTATTSEISKAYRKLSMQLHPDKNPGVKGVQERFARLGVVAAILRKKEARKRYDFFYKNGVPKWRGTGYYYSRFRPGLGTVATFLIIMTSGVQYVIQRMNYRRDLERIEKITREAKAAAWGAKMVPGAGQRKVRVNLGASQDEDGMGGTKWLDMVVEGQDVYILDAGEMHLIDTSTAIKPTIDNTWFLALLKSQFKKVSGKSKQLEAFENAEPNVDSGDDTSSVANSEPGSGTATPSEKGARAPATKAGGKRRKAVRKR